MDMLQTLSQLTPEQMEQILMLQQGYNPDDYQGSPIWLYSGWDRDLEYNFANGYLLVLPSRRSWRVPSVKERWYEGPLDKTGRELVNKTDHVALAILAHYAHSGIVRLRVPVAQSDEIEAAIAAFEAFKSRVVQQEVQTLKQAPKGAIMGFPHGDVGRWAEELKIEPPGSIDEIRRLQNPTLNLDLAPVMAAIQNNQVEAMQTLANVLNPIADALRVALAQNTQASKGGK